MSFVTDVSNSNSRDWEQFTSAEFRGATLHPLNSDFSGRIRAFEREGFRSLRLNTSGFVLERSHPTHQASQERSFALCMPVSGTQSTIIQDGKSTTLQVGDAAIFEMSRPHTLVHESNVTSLGIVIPVSALSFRALQLEQLIAYPMRAEDPVTQSVRNVLSSYEIGLPSMPEVAQVRAMRSVIDACETLFLHHASQAGVWEDNDDAKLLDGILKFIDKNLANPDLAPIMVAKANFISLRTLQKIARENGISISNRIRNRRLQRCRQDLTDPRFEHLGVAKIASRWGFENAAYFSVIFKEKYAVTPSVYRKMP